MDQKHYVLLNNGNLAISKTEWDSDSDKKAGNLESNGKYSIADGTTLIIFTDGDYEGGCDYAFAKNGHWYMY